MTDMTRKELISNLKQKLQVDDRSGSEVDLIGNKYALTVAMEPEDVTDEMIRRLQSVQGQKGLRLMVAIPPKTTVLKAARTKLDGTGIGIVDGRGLILKPFSTTRYRSVTLEPR